MPTTLHLSGTIAPGWWDGTVVLRGAPAGTRVNFVAGDTIIAETKTDESGNAAFFRNKCAIPIGAVQFQDLKIDVDCASAALVSVGAAASGIVKPIYFVLVTPSGSGPGNQTTPDSEFSHAIVIASGTLAMRQVSKRPRQDLVHVV